MLTGGVLCLWAWLHWGWAYRCCAAHVRPHRRIRLPEHHSALAAVLRWCSNGLSVTPPNQIQPRNMDTHAVHHPHAHSIRSGKMAANAVFERAYQICLAWVDQGCGVPFGIYLAYILKIAAVAVVLVVCPEPRLGSPAAVAQWWLHPGAESHPVGVLFEVLGLGCSSGPLTGHFHPIWWVHLLSAPWHQCLPASARHAHSRGSDRTWLDIGLYAFIIGALGYTLSHPR